MKRLKSARMFNVDRLNVVYYTGENLVFNGQGRQVFNVSRQPPIDFKWECAGT